MEISPASTALQQLSSSTTPSPYTVIPTTSSDANNTSPLSDMDWKQPCEPTEFHYFPKLPIELRLKIWHEAVDHTPRIFEIDLKKSDIIQQKLSDIGHMKLFTLARSSCPVRIPFPRVNHESRDELTKKFERLPFRNTVVFMDVELDTVYFRHRFRVDGITIMHKIMANNEVWAKVQNLAISNRLCGQSEALRWPRWPWSPRTMPNLKKLAIIFGDRFDYNPAFRLSTGAIPEPEVPDGVLEFYKLDMVPQKLFHHIATTSSARRAPFQVVNGLPVPDRHELANVQAAVDRQKIDFSQDFIPPIEFKTIIRGGKFRPNEWIIEDGPSWLML